MTQELRHEYLRAIQERDDKIVQLNEAFSEEQQRVSKATIIDVQQEFRELLERLERRGAEATGNGLSLMPAGRSGANTMARFNQGGYKGSQA